MNKENFKRRIDAMGRVSLPKPLRDRYHLEEGDEVEYFTTEDEEHNVYICIKTTTNNIERDAKILAKYGIQLDEKGNIKNH